MVKSLRTLLCLAALLGGSWTVSQGQSISTGSLSASAVCPPATLTVPFSVTGPFGTGNTFTAQLSDLSGNFSATPTAIGSLTANPASTTTLTISATIPAATTAGSLYKVRVISSVGNKSSISATILAVGTAAPLVPSTSPGFCQNTSPASVSATGQNLKWYTTESTTVVAGAGPTFPVSTTATGTIVLYVSQIVNGCESSRASLSVTVSPAPAAPVVSVPAPYCTNSMPVPVATAAGSGLRWYNALGEDVGSTAPVPTIPGTYTYTVSQSNGTCTSPKSAPYVLTVYPKADAPTMATVPYCANRAPASLSVTGTNLKWFTSAAGSTTITQPTPLTVTQTVYVQQTNGNGCVSDITTLTLSVNPQPLPPAVTPGVTVCAGTTAPLMATASSGNSLRWYGGNTSGQGSTSPPVTTAAGPQYVSQVSSNGCESEKAQITVTVNPIPGLPAATLPAPFCAVQPVSPLSATATATGATLNWYTSLTGPASSTAPTPVGTQTFYVSQSLNGCESAKVTLSVVVKPVPSAPSVMPVSVCFGKAADPLSASLLAGASPNWYASNTPGAAVLNAPPTPPTSATGVVNFYVSQTINGCEGARATLPVTVNAIPPMPTVTPAGPYCQGRNLPLLIASGQNLKWYGKDATGGTPTMSQQPDNNTIGVTSYFVTQTINSCESDRGSVAIQVKPTPGRPVTTAIEFCQNTPAPSLTATPFSTATLNWYGTNPNNTPSATAPAVPNTDASTLTYYVSQILDGCEGPQASLSVKIKPTPGPPITVPVAYCNNRSAQQLTATGQNLTWFDQNDNLLGNAPTPNTGAAGTQLFKVTQTVEGCVSNKATLTVTINALPDAPAIRNLQYCLPTPDQPMQTVGALTAVGQSLTWYNPDGNAYGQAPTPPISQTATIVYQVTQTVNSCESAKSTLQVSVQTAPAPVTPSPLVTYCRDGVAKPLEAVGTNLRWIDPNNTLLPANTTPTPPTLNATPVGGVSYQVYQTGNNGCVSPRSSIKVIINTNPTLALLGNQQIDLGQSATVQLRFTGAAPFSYTLSNGVSGTAFGDTSVVVIPRQTTVYQVGNVANVCGNGLPGDPATATVTVRVPTIITGNLNVNTLCAGNAFTVPYTTQGNFNLDLGYQVQLLATADTSARNPITLNTSGTTNNPISVIIPTNIPGGTYSVRVVRTVLANPLIQVLGRNSPSVLTVRPRPTAVLSGTQNLYEGSAANLTVAFGGDAPWVFTYTDSTRTFTGTATVTPYLIPVQPLKTTTYRLTSVSNNCDVGAVSGTATITVLPLLGVDEDPLSDAVKAYPIPATSRLTVDIDRPLYTESAHLEMVDMSGHVVQQQTTQSRRTDLDLSTHPAGLYILKVTIGDRHTTRKILKQ